MLTSTSYEYLMQIYEMLERGEKITPSSIGVRMNVKRPTAFEYLKKLESGGYLKKSGREYLLTELGMYEARRIIRHHRIIETLLYEAGVNLDKACNIAMRMQCILDDTSVENICRYLGYPKQCPHGRPIPEVMMDERH